MRKVLFLMALALLLSSAIPVSADRMTITLMVVHKNMPLGGAKVYVNEVLRGMTDKDGQFSFAIPLQRKGGLMEDRFRYNIKIETNWLSFQKEIEVVGGDARAILTIYVPWKR
jgi:hypothetical protein